MITANTDPDWDSLDNYDEVESHSMAIENGTDDVTLVMSDGTIIMVSVSEWGSVSVYKPKIVQAPHDGRDDGEAS